MHHKTDLIQKSFRTTHCSFFRSLFLSLVAEELSFADYRTDAILLPSQRVTYDLLLKIISLLTRKVSRHRDLETHSAFD